jgi:hypothetical protein
LRLNDVFFKKLTHGGMLCRGPKAAMQPLYINTKPVVRMSLFKEMAIEISCSIHLVCKLQIMILQSCLIGSKEHTECLFLIGVLKMPFVIECSLVWMLMFFTQKQQKLVQGLYALSLGLWCI